MISDVTTLCWADSTRLGGGGDEMVRSGFQNKTLGFHAIWLQPVAAETTMHRVREGVPCDGRFSAVWQERMNNSAVCFSLICRFMHSSVTFFNLSCSLDSNDFGDCVVKWLSVETRCIICCPCCLTDMMTTCKTPTCTRIEQIMF